MALTYTKSRDEIGGSLRHWYGTMTFDASYVTGGLLITPAAVGMQRVFQAYTEANPAASRIATFAPATGKLLLFTALSTEAAAASDQSTITVPVHVVGY